LTYYTYIIQSIKTEKLYIGQTNNLSHRLSLHNTDQVLSTKKKGAWKLIYSKEFENRSEAVQLEIRLKNWKNRVRILNWIKKQNKMTD